MQKNEKYLKVILYVTLLCLMSLITFKTIDNLAVFIKGADFILVIIFSILLYLLLFDRDVLWLFVLYSLFVFVIMFFRISSSAYFEYSFKFYLLDWLKLIKTNRIVFINILGNLVLFMPLVWFLNYYWPNSKWYSVWMSILIIILMEWLQAVFKKGVFDIVDIIVNVIGILIGILILSISKGVIQWTANKKIRKI